MPTTNLGRIGFVSKGDWVAGTYKNLDIVSYLNSLYICKVLTTTADPTVVTDWDVYVSETNASNILHTIGSGLANEAYTKAEIDASFSPVSQEVYDIGIAGTYGFGVGALRNADIPTGWTGLSGHESPASVNYGNYIDPVGSHMVFIPRFWFKWDGNTPLVSSVPATGYALHEAFRHAPKGFFRDKTHVGIIGGVPLARMGIAPASSSSSNNGIGQLVDIAYNHAGFIEAFKTYRSASHHVESVFESNALAVLAKAHSAAAKSVFECAFNDVAPYMPKGNNNNALADVNDTGVTFQNAGYSSSALAGSGDPFAKTTHNGQACGVADINGNLWRINIGMTKANNTDGIFQVLKTTVNPNDLTLLNLQDATLYDDIDLTALIGGNLGWVDFGNAAEQVFDSNQAINGLDTDIRVTCAGLPKATGVSASGTTEFGNDGLYRSWTTNLISLAGGFWSNSATAGAFARRLDRYSAYSSYNVGAAACVSL